jgi:hypothetical protein
MMKNNWEELVNDLRGREYQFGVLTPETPVHHVQFEQGLSGEEIVRIEGTYGFRFPPDLAAFLQTALPIGPRFPNWRSGDQAHLREWLSTPLEGILFDIEQNGMWFSAWGNRPESIEHAKRIARKHIDSAPHMIPIFGHRMMPDEPHEAGNPVFSIHQTDIIYFGFDLADYLRAEFQLPGRKTWPTALRDIPFWTKNFIGDE